MKFEKYLQESHESKVDPKSDMFLCHTFILIIFFFSDIYNVSRHNSGVQSLMPDNEIPPTIYRAVPICACGVHRGPPERLGTCGLVRINLPDRYIKPIPIRGKIIPTKWGCPPPSFLTFRRGHGSSYDVDASNIMNWWMW